jgi:Asp-tRNA(Asn)/Glu-tRNA(Gln) amidotransferase A subunit family amidase
MTHRKCNTCGEVKEIGWFAKDKTRAESRAYICKTCKSKEAKKRRKNQAAKRTKAQFPEHMMTEEAFKLYYYNARLRWFIQAYAKRRSKKDRERQADFRQIAWARIAMCQPGRSIEYYESVARRAIYAEYYRMWSQRKYDISYEETLSRDEHSMWMHGVYM